MLTINFDIYSNKLKNNIKKLVENNKLDRADELIKQYENMVTNDIEIYSIKAVIEMLKGNYTEAEKLLKNGLQLEPDNFDLLYNISYLYQTKGEVTLAIKYYKSALKFAEKAEDIEQINNALQGLCSYELIISNSELISIDRIKYMDEQLKNKYNL